MSEEMSMSDKQNKAIKICADRKIIYYIQEAESWKQKYNDLEIKYERLKRKVENETD